MPALVAFIAQFLEIAAALWALVKTTAVMAALAGLLYVLFTSEGWKKLEILLGNVVRGAVRAAAPLATELLNDAKPAITAIVGIAETAAADIKADIEGAARAAADASFNSLKDELYKNSNVQPEQWPEIAATAFGDAAAWGLTSAAVTGIFESMFPEKLNSLNILGPMFAGMAGFHEITNAFMRPILGAAIARPAQYDANAQFRSLKPSLGQAMQMYSRRKIQLADAELLQSYAGLDLAWETGINALAFRPISPRALATAIVDTPFPTDTLRAVLQDNGLSDANVQFMLDVLLYNSTKNVRQTYVSALQTCYQHGAMSDQELSDSLNALGWSTDAVNFVIQTAALHRRVTLAQKVEAQIVPLVAAGNITDVQGLQQLEAAGIQEWYADLEITLATTKATILAAKLEASAAHRKVVAEQRAGVKAAIAQFEDGVFDAAGLAAALVLIGTDPVVVAATVATEEARLAGRQKILYGQTLTAQQARVLSDTVNAIITQMKKELIDPATAYAQLKALGLDDPELNAIFARAAASIAALTKHGILIDPQTGQPG
jgi:hypothetical protein